MDVNEFIHVEEVMGDKHLSLFFGDGYPEREQNMPLPNF